MSNYLCDFLEYLPMKSDRKLEQYQNQALDPKEQGTGKHSTWEHHAYGTNEAETSKTFQEK